MFPYMSISNTYVWTEGPVMPMIIVKHTFHVIKTVMIVGITMMLYHKLNGGRKHVSLVIVVIIRYL